MAKFLDLQGLQTFKEKLDGLFATKASLNDYQLKITEDAKLSKDLVSGLGTAAEKDVEFFATAAQGEKADAAIPNPSAKVEGNFLKFNGTNWVAADVPDTGVLSIAKGDDTIIIGGTAANPTVKVDSTKFDAAGAAEAVRGVTTETVATVDAKAVAAAQAAAAAQETANKGVADAATAQAAAEAAQGAAEAAQDTADGAVTAAQNAQATADKAVVANAAITGGTHTKITYDAKGLVTGGADLVAGDIPVLDASKITTGEFGDARIASAATWNAKQDALSFTGTYNSSSNKVVLQDYVADAVALAANGGREVVVTLPTPTEAEYKKKMIYLYKPEGASSYEEYIIAKNGTNYVLEKIGDTDIQLVNYWSKAELVAITDEEINGLFD